MAQSLSIIFDFKPRPKLKLQIDRLLEERSVDTGGPAIDTRSDLVASSRLEAVRTSVGLGRKFRWTGSTT